MEIYGIKKPSKTSESSYLKVSDQYYNKNEVTNIIPFSQHGLVSTDGVNEIRPKGMFEEVDVPDVLVDKKGYPVRFTDGVYDRLSKNRSNFDTKYSLNSVVGATDFAIKNITTSSRIVLVEYSQNIQSGKTGVYVYGVNAATYTSDKKYSRVIVLPSAGTYSFRLRTSGTTTSEVYNISIRELPQWQLPKAPFAPGATDELLDYSQHGVTTQVDHSNGDIVVNGNSGELFVDGGFDDINQWNLENGATISNGQYVSQTTDNCDSTGKNYFTPVVGIDYVLEYEVISNTDFSGQLQLRDSSNQGGGDFVAITDLSVGKHTIVGKFLYQVPYRFRLWKNTGSIVLDNISLKVKDQAYIAKTNTTAGTLVTDSSKFKPIPYVTKQVALLIEKTSSGAIVNTVKPLVNMYGEESVLTYEEDIMGELGFAKKADRVWTDGSSEYILIGLKGYLNAGAYHPWFNVFGSNTIFYYAHDANYLWYEKIYDHTDIKTSVFNMFVFEATDYNYVNPNSGKLLAVSGRPDSKFYDKCYIEGQGGLVCFAIPNAKTTTYKHFEEVRRNLNDGYIENGVETYLYANLYYSAASARISLEKYMLYISGGTDDYRLFKNGKQITGYKGKEIDFVSTDGSVVFSLVYKDEFALKRKYVMPNGVDYYGLPILGDSYFDLTAKYKSTYLVTQGSTTHTDIIGNPASYPQDLKDLLAQGQGVGFCNALLVGQDGTSYILNSTNGTTPKTFSKKAINNLSFVISSNERDWSGYRYRDQTYNAVYTLDNINNNFTTYRTSDQQTWFWLAQYNAQNQSAVPVQTPQPIQAVDRSLIASNSHSVYSYNGLTYAATTKVATGNSIESMYANNAETIPPHYDYILDCDISQTTTDGKIYYVINSAVAPNGLVFKKINGGTGVADFKNFDFEANPTGYLILWKPTLPKHNAITLDSNSIVASKALLTQTAKGTQVFAQELLYDSTNGNFGDTGEFEQLAPGTITDLNGHTVQTKILYKPSSIKLGDE